MGVVVSFLQLLDERGAPGPCMVEVRNLGGQPGELSLPRLGWVVRLRICAACPSVAY